MSWKDLRFAWSLGGGLARLLLAGTSEADGGDGRPMGPKGGTGENRVLVEGLDEYTSWQDLKDFARRAGNPVFTEVYRDRGAKVGVIEFRNRDDVYAACRALDGMVLHDRRVRVTE
eukprot:CAMPEP_0177694122 /NCGR_PEP_ID=MMETSP0484_2-20121128/2770_1 /TAXON_ID=354590 /ORGANISM="Rhodomonas lens, Strain RHODO" /LENGTH=115 /DNA_ID=CAMNT_0019204989 /DNA_START=1072 /DNA_END=1416 /DNA_ORIENTATION=+